MRHRKHTAKLGRTSSHKRCLMANMLKDLIDKERIVTTVPRAKELRRYAERLVTLAKKNTLASRRRVISELMIRYNALTPKDQRRAKEGDTSAYNTDRKVVGKLFEQLALRFAARQGGYTRILKKGTRVGDNSALAVIEYLAD